MIVGRAFCKVIDGMSINVGGSTIVVKNNMGNQDALDKFIALSDSRGEEKYPLVFFGISDVYQESNGWKSMRTKVYIMMNTREELLYKNRTDETYAKYIEPIYKELIRVLRTNPYVQVIGDNIYDKYPYTDVPNFGMSRSDVGSKTSKESVVTDYVDARVIDIDFRIKINCI